MTPDNEAHRLLELYRLASSDWEDEDGSIDSSALNDDIKLTLGQLKSTSVKDVAWTGGAGDLVSIGVMEYADRSGVTVIMSRTSVAVIAGDAARHRKKAARLARKHGMQRASKSWRFNVGDSDDYAWSTRWDMPDGFRKMRRK